jgi:hypothetical protein
LQDNSLHHSLEWFGQNSCDYANSLSVTFAKEKPVYDILLLKVFR